MESEKLSKKEIKEQLWRLGELSWLLDKNQKEMRDLFYNSAIKTQVWLLARRSGKTRSLCVLALEQCIKKPNSIVKFLSPTKIQVNNNVRPIFRELLESCPENLKPEFRAKDYIYFFPNGSEIQLAGTDSGHAEKLRGGNSEICIVDEAAFCSDLKAIVKDILAPTTLMTRGKIILASTPPKDSDHEFLAFIEDAEHRKALFKKTIYDNPRLTDEMIQEAIDECGGITSESFRREYLCEILNSESTVIPEFNSDSQKDIVKEHEMPPYMDAYVSMDLGGKDLTVVLFGFFDFRADKIVIQDEIVMDFAKADANIKVLASEILKKEEQLWTNKLTHEILKPTRVSDINYIALKELQNHSDYKLNFQIAKKDDKQTAINVLRVMVGNKKVVIDPKCVTLIKHLTNAKYHGNNKILFARSPDMGHYDALDALLYFVRAINYKKNPYPAHYQSDLRSADAFGTGKTLLPSQNKNLDIYKKLFNIKR